jgi:glycosyltransferase involved in cell wall biosynthesis
MPRRLRVAIDCRIADPRQGIGTAVLALAKALSESNVTNQEYTFIVRERMKGWLAPYVYGPCRLEGISEPLFSVLKEVKASLRLVAPLRIIWRKLREGRESIPVSDGLVESYQFDVVHFPTQAAYLTKLPTIYQPHDLQHLHFPQFFSKTEFACRERLYRAFCNQACYVCVQTNWTKQDVIKQYQLQEDKVVVIPWGSVFDAYKTPSDEDVRNTIDKYKLPDRFFFYPAVTWPHKNHKAIISALHILKSSHGIAPHVVFTGSSTDHRMILDKLAQDLGVAKHVHFLGFVTPVELQAIFRTATAMIYPSLFEGFGLPILEAFQARLPVLSSNATTLPEVAQDGALYFDPDSPAKLSVLMKTIMDRPEVRHDLINNGTRILSEYSFRDTAAAFQALYEKTAALSSLKIWSDPLAIAH